MLQYGRSFTWGFFISIFSLIILAPHGSGTSASPASALFPVGFVLLAIVHLLTIVGSLALTVFYIIRVFKTEAIDQNMKIAWILLLFFMGLLVQPVFWYLYIWREPAAIPSQLPSANTLGTSNQGNYAPSATDYSRSTPPDWR